MQNVMLPFNACISSHCTCPRWPYILSPGSACLQARLTEQHPCSLHSQSQPVAASKACPAAREPRAECPGHLCFDRCVWGRGSEAADAAGGCQLALEGPWGGCGGALWGMLRGSWGLGWVVGVERVWPRGRENSLRGAVSE